MAIVLRKTKRTLNLGNQVKKVAPNVRKYVKKTIQKMAETKRYDSVAPPVTFPVAVAPNASFLSGYLSAVAIGDQTYQRTGAVIRPMGLKLRMACWNGTPNAFEWVRCLIYQYKTATGAGVVALPGAQDIFQNNNGVPGSDVFSGVDVGNKSAIHILHDKIYKVMGANPLTNDFVMHYKEINIPARRFLKTIRFNGISALSSDSGYGALYVIFLSTNGPQTTVKFISQFSYTDL